ncbi:serine protease [Halobacteriovorax sp. HLS]|uniref:trypsin-like serine peptidase n=1 Tax=Halobacteriovorax sp. HLS TaxID=2234000 RepID=UPI000FDCBE3D|nr:trypsin-like serine protease [Halobacteriovorax sp. HLS]
MKSILFLIVFISLNSQASDKSICGDSDDRTLSNDRKIARASSLNRLAGCTVTMIGRSCAVSAGHCVDALEKASFNVPDSDETGLKESIKEDIYLRSKDYLRYKNNGVGNDWAVIKLLPNKVTGKYPGDVQGYYSVALEAPIRLGDKVTITGYGLDQNDPNLSFSQQTNSGSIKKIGRWLKPSAIEHLVDTMGGNSGSSIISNSTNKIIGIHTHGGCDSKGSNQGTLISKNKVFKDAIKSCLDWERTIE